MVIMSSYLSHFKIRKEPYMIKQILLSLLVVIPILGKNGAQEAELMAKLNKLESIRQEIAEKEKRIDELNKQSSDLLSSMTYGYDKEQLRAIWKEASRLESHIIHAINNNIDINKAIKEPLCPDLIVHRNELDRMHHSIVRMAVDYFFLHKLYQKYDDLFTEIAQMQSEL
jgi:hypothetical protein